MEIRDKGNQGGEGIIFRTGPTKIPINKSKERKRKKMAPSHSSDGEEEKHHVQAKCAWGELLGIGEIPTRYLLDPSNRNTKVQDDRVYYLVDDGGTGELLSYFTGEYPCQHRILETQRFEAELADWKEFLQTRKIKGGSSSLGPVGGTYSVEEAVLGTGSLEQQAQFIASLKVLDDWRHFRAWREGKAESYRKKVEECEDNLAWMHKLEKGGKRGPHLVDQRRLIKEKCYVEEAGFEREENLLLRMQKQLPNILISCITSTCGFLVFRQILEGTCQAETTQLLAEFRALPSWFRSTEESLRRIQEAMEILGPYKTHPEISSEVDEWKFKLLFSLFCWTDQYIGYERELAQWGLFREWQGRQPQMLGHWESSEKKDWEQFRTYQEEKVNKAREVVKVWQKEFVSEFVKLDVLVRPGADGDSNSASMQNDDYQEGIKNALDQAARAEKQLRMQFPRLKMIEKQGPFLNSDPDSLETSDRGDFASDETMLYLPLGPRGKDGDKAKKLATGKSSELAVVRSSRVSKTTKRESIPLQQRLKDGAVYHGQALEEVVLGLSNLEVNSSKHQDKRLLPVQDDLQDVDNRFMVE